jgi:hypothetical protein
VSDFRTRYWAATQPTAAPKKTATNALLAEAEKMLQAFAAMEKRS